MQEPALTGDEVGTRGVEHFVWLLGSLYRIHRVPFDAALLLQQFPPPYARHCEHAYVSLLHFRLCKEEIRVNFECANCDMNAAPVTDADLWRSLATEILSKVASAFSPAASGRA